MNALTIKAYGQREVEIDTAREHDEVMLGITAVTSYERDVYAFLNREAATQLRDWLNGFLSSHPSAPLEK